MGYYSEPERNGGGKVVLVIALITLVLVGAVVFGGMFFLARGGALATLLGEPATEEIGPATPAPTWTGVPAAAQATPLLLVTATPRYPTLTPVAAQQQATLAALTPTAGASPTPADAPTLTPTGGSTAAGAYRVEYLGCTKHASDTGTVKGQVFDRQGQVVVGAEVLISIDDWAYDKPAISNGSGWYEFYLQKKQHVKIRALRIKGVEMSLVGVDQEFRAQGGCFEYVNLRQN